MNFFPKRFIISVLCLLVGPINFSHQCYGYNELESNDVLHSSTSTKKEQAKNDKPKHEKTQKGKPWSKFDYSETGFSISFPSTPSHLHKIVEINSSNISIAYDTYLCEHNPNLVYVVTVWDYPQLLDTNNPNKNLKEGFGGMVSAIPNSEVLLVKISELQGFNSLEFAIKSNNVEFKGMLLVANSKFYQVITVYRNDEQSAEVDKFLSSFVLNTNATESKKNAEKTQPKKHVPESKNNKVNKKEKLKVQV